MCNSLMDLMKLWNQNHLLTQRESSPLVRVLNLVSLIKYNLKRIKINKNNKNSLNKNNSGNKSNSGGNYKPCTKFKSPL